MWSRAAATAALRHTTPTRPSTWMKPNTHTHAHLLRSHSFERRHLPLQVPALAPPEPFQVSRHEIYAMQPRQRLRGALVRRRSLRPPQAGEGRIGEDATFHELHDVERGADDRGVLAEEKGARDGNGGVR